MNKKYKITISSCVIILLLIIIYIFFFSLPHSVKSFGPFKLGEQAPVVSENVPEYEIFYGLEYKFYIYAMEEYMSFCVFGDCGMSGVLVDCLGGWLSGEGIHGDGGATDYGLTEEDVDAGRSSMILVANKNKKIVGIYPNYTVRNIPYILKNHRNLFSDFDFCYDIQMPSNLLTVKKFK